MPIQRSGPDPGRLLGARQARRRPHRLEPDQPRQARHQAPHRHLRRATYAAPAQRSGGRRAEDAAGDLVAGDDPRRLAVPALSSSTARIGRCDGIGVSENGTASGATWTTVPWPSMNSMSSGKGVFFIQNATICSALEVEQHAVVGRMLRRYIRPRSRSPGVDASSTVKCAARWRSRSPTGPGPGLKCASTAAGPAARPPPAAEAAPTRLARGRGPCDQGRAQPVGTGGAAAMDLKAHIRQIPDFPKPGILFYDISTLLAHGEAWRETVDRVADAVRAYRPRRAGRHRIARLHLRRPGSLPAGAGLHHGAQGRQAAGGGGQPRLRPGVRQRHAAGGRGAGRAPGRGWC